MSRRIGTLAMALLAMQACKPKPSDNDTPSVDASALTATTATASASATTPPPATASAAAPSASASTRARPDVVVATSAGGDAVRLPNGQMVATDRAMQTVGVPAPKGGGDCPRGWAPSVSEANKCDKSCTTDAQCGAGNRCKAVGPIGSDKQCQKS